MKIRAYTRGDKNAVIGLLRSNTPTYFAAAEVRDLVNYLDHEAEDYYVVKENGRVVGAGGVNYFSEKRTARISWDIIAPDSQGKGIGRELTAFRINRLKANHDIDRIVVRTTQMAYKFYEKSGFVVAKTAKDFWAENFDLYQMELTNNHSDV